MSELNRRVLVPARRIALALIFQSLGCEDAPAPAGPSGAASVPRDAAPLGNPRFSISISHPQRFFGQLDKKIGGEKGLAARGLLGPGAAGVGLDGDGVIVLDATGMVDALRLTQRAGSGAAAEPVLTVTFEGDEGLAALPFVVGVLAERMKLASTSPGNPALLVAKGYADMLGTAGRFVKDGLSGVQRVTLSISPTDRGETLISVDAQLTDGAHPLTPLLQWMTTPTASPVAALGEASRFCPQPSLLILAMRPHGVMPGGAIGQLTTLLPQMVKGTAWRDPIAESRKHVAGPVIQCQGAGPDGYETWEVISFDDDAAAMKAALTSIGNASGSTGGIQYELQSGADALTFNARNGAGTANVVAARIVGGRLVTVMGGSAALEGMKRIDDRAAGPVPALAEQLTHAPGSAAVDLRGMLDLDRAAHVRGEISSKGRENIHVELTFDDGGVWLLHHLVGATSTP